MIEVKNLVKRYGDHTVVDNLSFTVNDGQIYGFLGPNGAGKSTTMNIITGYIGMTEGEVIVNGHSITDEPNEVRRLVGYLPEQPPLYPDMTPKEYLMFAAELKKIPKSEREDAVNEVMDMTMITSRQDRLIKNLSKGYRQRVGFAQAILGYPDVIILDEPTAGLDVIARNEVLDLLRKYLAEDDERRMLISSHISTDLENICDDIYMIHNGKIVFHEDTDSLLYNYAVLKVSKSAYEKLDKQYIITTVEEPFGYSCFTGQRKFYVENYPDIVTENCSIDDMIIMMSGGRK